MGAGRGLRVKLNGDDWEFSVPHSLQGLIVQVYVSRLNMLVPEGTYVDAEPMILGCYAHLALRQILTG